MKYHVCRIADKALLQRDVPPTLAIGPGEILITTDDDGYTNPSDAGYVNSLAFGQRDPMKALMALALLARDRLNLITGSSAVEIAAMQDISIPAFRDAFVAKYLSL